MAFSGFERKEVMLSAAALALANSSPPVVIAVPADRIAQLVSWAMIRTAGTIQSIGYNLRYAGTEIDIVSSPFAMDGVAMDVGGSRFDSKTLVELSGADVVLRAPFDNTGAALTIAVNNGGASWATNDTFEFSEGAAVATGRVTAQTGGVATAVEVVSGAYNFRAGQTGIEATNPSGSGNSLTIDISTITPANSSGILNVCYQLIPV